MPKMKKSIFLFFFYYNSYFYSNFKLKFCVGLRNAIEKSYAKKRRKSISENSIYANISYKSIPKPVGRIEPYRFERVKHVNILHAD